MIRSGVIMLSKTRFSILYGSPQLVVPKSSGGLVSFDCASTSPSTSIPKESPVILILQSVNTASCASLRDLIISPEGGGGGGLPNKNLRRRSYSTTSIINPQYRETRAYLFNFIAHLAPNRYVISIINDLYN